VRLALDRRRTQVADCSAPAAHLRGQDDFVPVAAVGYPAPDDRLGAAVLYQGGVGGVDEAVQPNTLGPRQTGKTSRSVRPREIMDMSLLGMSRR
jgi:hypothetical protein